MGDLTFYDAAFPPADPPATDGVCLYIGGDTPHVWTLEEIGMQAARYRLPIFVRSNPPGPGAAQDVASALSRLKVIGAPRGTLVAWDMETAADALYIKGVTTGLASGGYRLIVYGSESTVRGNGTPDGLYWGADWTNVAHLHSGDAMTQFVSFAAFDESLALPTLPFWDAQAPKAPAPPRYAAVTLRVPLLSEGADDAHLPHWYVRRAQMVANGVFRASPQLAVDGSFGAATRGALEAVQRGNRLPVTGQLDAATWSLLLAGE
jgi:peptidoglycan hydrolase-like protein with peptidoglycan-binding domain